jgi:hypothetical protein
MDFGDIRRQPFSDAWRAPGAADPGGFRPEAPVAALPMTHDQLHLVPFPVVMGQVAARFNVPEEIAFAYQVDQSELMNIPLVREPTPTPAEQVADGKHGALAHLILDADSIEAGTFQDVSQMARSDRRMASRAARSSPGAIEGRLRSDINRPWIQGIFNGRGDGLHRSNTLGIATMAFYVSYGPEIADYDSEHMGNVALDEETAQLLFGEDAQAGSVAINLVSDVLRREGKVDLSNEALDDRVAAFLSLATVEMAALAVRDVRDYGKLGGKKAATQLYEKHKDTLFTNGVAGPMELLDELAESASAAARATPAAHRITKALLSAKAEQSSRTAAHMPQFMGMMRAIYDRLGYPYHPALLSAEERGAAADAESAVAGEALGAAAPEVPEDLEEAALTVGSLVDAVGAEKQERLIYHHLDEIILPDDVEGGLEGEDFQDRLRKIAEDMAARPEVESGDVQIIWERLFDLAHIASYYGGRLYRSKAGALGTKKIEPYFVTFFSLNNNYGVAESPVYSHGTYVVSEEYANTTPLEVLKMKRKAARENGAVSIPHVKPYYHGFRHQQKIHEMIAAFEEGNLPKRHALMKD